ncbi:MAG: hypothetical protein IJ751_08170, partial [Oscillospiraceae bacterium]|nr:hypothetical protein [Oscillospiraceae bacterium]
MSTAGNQIDDAYRLFFRALTRRSLRDLTNAAHHILDLPILINNEIAINLAQAPAHAIGDPDWDDLLENKSSSSEHFLRFYTKYILNSDLTTFPLLINDGSKATRAQLFSVLRYEGRILGYSAVLLPTERSAATEDELQVVRMFNHAATSLLGVEPQLSLPDSKQGEQTLSDILTFAGIKSPTQQAYVTNLAIKYKPPYRILVARNTRPYYSGGHGIAGAKMCKDLTSLDPSSLSVAYQDLVVTLFSQSSGIDGDRRLNTLLDFANQLSFQIAVSAPFDSLPDTYGYFEQAELTLEAGRRLVHNKTIFYFEELMPTPIFTAFSNQYAIAPFLHPIIRQLYL